jgi:hypothetical protein
MTKKLFVVLVVVAAMLAAISWALAAKKPMPGVPELVEMPKFTDQQGASEMPRGVMVDKETALSVATGHPQKATAGITAAGPLTGSLNRSGGKDFCDLYGSAAYAITDWFYGLEWYANYQDPEEFGCAAVWPFLVADVGFNIIVDAAISIDVQGFVYNADWTVPDCPVPFQEVCQTPLYTVDIPDAGHWAIGLPLQEECCVYEPYFAVIYIATDLYGSGADAVSEDMVPCDCRSYNDYGAGWEDLCVIYGWPGPMMLWSDGYTSPQNDCPTEGDTCGVTSVTPDLIQVLPGGAGVFTANVFFQGNQTECLLTVTPDPVCPSCVTTIVPNPVTDPPVATVTIQTDASTPPGLYTFDVGGSKAEAAIEVLALDDSCELKRDNEAWAWFFSGYQVGDQDAILMDPEAMCIGCGPDVYPFEVNYVKALLYDHAAVGGVDVIFHFYEAPMPYCDGPGAEIYQFPGSYTTHFEWVVYPLPEPFCVNGPFWVAIEYNSGVQGEIPCLLMEGEAYVDTCTQFIWDIDLMAWVEWADFWSPPPPGAMSLRAGGTCNAACPVECYLIQDPGEIAYYFGNFAYEDVIAKYFDPALYCEEPLYPLLIHDVDFILYDFAGAGSVDLIVDVHIVCHDSCDGPGTQIYKSEPFTINTFYPDMAHIDLEDVVCVYEPFFISLEYASGVQGETPSFLWSDETYPCDSCHAWMYWASGGYPFWIEWHDFWAPPAGGCPIIRVSAATSHPDCQQEPCDTTLETLWGGPYAYYYWKQPPNDEFMNMMFQLPGDHGGRLDEIEIAWYQTGSYGTPDPDIYVWFSDGAYPLDNNPPYQAIAEFNLTYGDIVWYPSYTVIQSWDLGIVFDPGEKFHIGYSHGHETDDTLSILSDDGAAGCDDRASGWDGSAWGTYSPYGFLINAVICPIAPPESTFTIACSPFLAYATPGDPPAALFEVDVGQVLGYDLVVDLSCTPPAGFNVTFDPASANAPFTSDAYVSVDLGVAYDDYTLTFCGLGADGQGPKCCDVKVRVQPPYDECTVEFYHGVQRGSNFGAVGNDASSTNFVWYGMNMLFDGSFIIATDGPDKMALDVYNCVYWDWLPEGHANTYFDPTYNANVCFGEFYSDVNVVGERDSVWIVGIMDECIDFSIKIKIYYNVGPDPINGMYISMFEDWDVGDAYNNAGAIDSDHNLAYIYDPLDDQIVFGTMKAPFYDDPLYNMYIIPNYAYVWPCAGFCDMSDTDPQFYCLDSLYWLMTQPGYFGQVGPDSDFSILQTAGPIDLPVDGKHIEIWVDFGRNLMDGLTWSQWWHKVLRYAGFYRGDVNASDTLELPSLDVSDLVYLVQYLFQGGPEPEPYADQGDVNANRIVNVEDVVYLLNYVFHQKGGPPIDYPRFIPSMWTRPSLFENPLWD